MADAPDPYPRLPYPPSAPFPQRVCEAEEWLIFLMNRLNCQNMPDSSACIQASYDDYVEARNACPAE